MSSHGSQIPNAFRASDIINTEPHTITISSFPARVLAAAAVTATLREASIDSSWGIRVLSNNI